MPFDFEKATVLVGSIFELVSLTFSVISNGINE